MLSPARLVDAIDRRQRRSRWLAFPVAVILRYSEDRGGQLAALIAYWGFFSLFPLLLVFVTILGVVLHGDPGAQHAVLHSALSQYPIIGTQITANIHSLNGDPLSLAIGLAGTLLAGLGVTGAIQNAFEEVWHVPRSSRAGSISWRLRGVAQLALLGLLVSFSTLAAGFVTSQSPDGAASAIVAALLALTANIALFYISFWLYSPGERCGTLWPGVLSGALGWQLLQHLGGYYVAAAIRHASATSALFALVIGMLVWLYLGARLLVIAIEVNAVRELRLWPRGLRER